MLAHSYVDSLSYEPNHIYRRAFHMRHTRFTRQKKKRHTHQNDDDDLNMCVADCLAMQHPSIPKRFCIGSFMPHHSTPHRTAEHMSRYEIRMYTNFYIHGNEMQINLRLGIRVERISSQNIATQNWCSWVEVLLSNCAFDRQNSIWFDVKWKSMTIWQ